MRNDLTHELVLASGSPRRRQLLQDLKLPFTVITSGVPEEVDPTFGPIEAAKQLAELKARAVASTLQAGLVIGADTVVTLDGLILGKPADAADAKRMLRLLRARTHQVITAVAIIKVPGPHVVVSAVSSDVCMEDYDEQELDAYVATGEVMDKAGSYAVQGQGGHLVQAVTGCYNNVVGFPLCEVSTLLSGLGLTPPVSEPVCQLPGGAPCPRLSR